MSGDFDPHAVHLYITEVMVCTPIQRMALWMSIVYKNDPEDSDKDCFDAPVPHCPMYLRRRFLGYKNLAVQANILFRFGPIIDKIVRDAAQKWAGEARKTGDM